MDVIPEYLPRLEALLPILGRDTAVWRADRPFSRQAWQNRTRLRNPDGWQWITVPIEHGHHGEAIFRTRIAYHDGWRKRHLKAFKYNYSTSPFYEHYKADLHDLLSTRYETLHMLNKATIDMILGWLGHSVSWEIRSEPAGTAMKEISSAVPFKHPVYRQNYPGFIPDMTCLDILFTNGPAAIHQLAAHP